MAKLVKNPPAMQETWVRSLGWEDALEKGMATHSSIFAWRIPWATADDDCSHEIKRRLLPGRKGMTSLQSALKSRDFANKGPYSQSYGFPSSHVQS